MFLMEKPQFEIKNNQEGKKKKAWEKLESITNEKIKLNILKELLVYLGNN